MLSNISRRAAAVAGSVLLVALGFVLGTTVFTGTTTAPASLDLRQAPPAAQIALTENERLFADIYNRVSPSVVSINVTSSRRIATDTFESSGTGFVLDQQGHIATNSHVVDGASRIEVNFLDGTIVAAQTVALDPDSDLAVLKVDLPAEKLYPVTLGNSDELFIGQTVLAIGSPFGQRWTLTSGIISALDRTIQGLTQFSVGSVIQTDAAINPGNSGGPLLNLRGEVIGVNSQIISRTRSNSGIGFAVPSNLVARVARELVAAGRVNYSYLGISSISEEGLSLRLIEALQLPNAMRGIVVGSVAPGGPAERAGLRGASNPVQVQGVMVPSAADVITAIDGVPMTGMSSLVSYLAINTVPGQTITLTVWRGGQMFDLPVTLGARR